VSHLPFVFHSRKGDYGPVFIEPGTDATFNTSFFASTAGVVTSDASVVHTGTRSLKCFSGNDGGEGNTTLVYSQRFKVSETNRLNKGRCSFYFRFDTIPDNPDPFGGPGRDTIFIFESISPSVSNVYQLAINESSQLILHSDDGIELAVGSILSLNTWYRICVAHNLTSTTVNEIRVFINGTLDISVSNVSLVRFNPERAVFGQGRVNSTPDASFYFDNIYIDDKVDLSDTGDIRVTAKLPNSNSTNNFGTAIGNNPSNRYENVNERVASDANGWQENSGGPYPIDENYGIQGASTGDIDISSYTGGYPASPACGLRNSSTSGINLYECGVCIAYSVTTNEIVATMSWALAASISGNVANLKIFFGGSAVDVADGSSGNASINLTTTKSLVFTFNYTPSPKPMIFHSRTDQGYQVVFMEGGTDATRDLKFYLLNSGGTTTITSDASVSKTGPCSIKLTSNQVSSDEFASVLVKLPDGPYAIPGPGFRTSFYIRFSAYPAASLDIFARIFAIQTGDQDVIITVDNSGVLRLLLVDGVFPNYHSQVGGNGPTLSTNTWYRICYTQRVYGEYANEYRVYVDGSLAISVSNFGGKFPNGGSPTYLPNPHTLYYGFTITWLVSPMSMYLDDIYVDNSDMLSDTGDIRIIHKRPNSNRTNNFPVAVGNNPANRYENVNEQPLSISNGWLDNVGTTTGLEESYGIEAANAGDVDISTATGVYPSALPSVGVRTNSSGGLYLYECGVHIAVNSNNNSIVASKSWAYLATSIGSVNSENVVYLLHNGSTS